VTSVANLAIERDALVLKMSRLERLGALHVDVKVPTTAVASIEVAPDPWAEVRGVRAPGTGIPRIIMIGTTRGSFGRDFCVIRGRGPAVVVNLCEGPFQRWIVSATDALEVAANLGSALGL